LISQVNRNRKPEDVYGTTIEPKRRAQSDPGTISPW
jgi:hypothetical protein